MILGNYRDLITLQRPAFTENAIGERVPGWETVASVYASVRPAGPGESATSYTVRMHYREDVQTTWRAIFRTKPLYFKAVADVQNRGIELEATAVDQQGQAA